MPTDVDAALDRPDAEERKLSERLAFAVRLVGDALEINPQIRSGVPVLRGTRFPASQVLAELAAGRSLAQIVEEWDLDENVVRSFLEGLSIQIDRPFSP